MIQLLKKEYDGESIIDIESDIEDALNSELAKQIPTYHGLLTGTFTVTVQWSNE